MNDDKIAGEDEETAGGDGQRNRSKKKNIDILDKYVVVVDENLYSPPAEIIPGDLSAMTNLDTNKLHELHEVFNIIDFNGDGVIDEKDLKAIFISMGQSISDEQAQAMIEEAPGPLNFDNFSAMVGLKTIDLDSEEDLIEAFKLWDDKEEGVISEEKLLYELMSHGNRFTEKEAWAALEQAPIKKGTEHGFGCSGEPMIEYEVFAKQCSGLRKKAH